MKTIMLALFLVACGGSVEPSPEKAEPIITDATCDKEMSVTGTTFWYAQADYPGRTVAELASVSALMTHNVGDGTGDRLLSVGIYVRAGSVWTICEHKDQAVMFVEQP